VSFKACSAHSLGTSERLALAAAMMVGMPAMRARRLRTLSSTGANSREDSEDSPWTRVLL
jgi:hypothetical protein